MKFKDNTRINTNNDCYSKSFFARRINIFSILASLIIFFSQSINLYASNFNLNGLAALMASNNISEVIYFTENKNFRFLNKPLTLNGRFYFRSSNFLQKNIDKPFVKIYTLKSNTITYTDKKLESETLTLKDHPLIYASMKAFYTTMTGNFNRLKSSNTIELTGTVEQWQIVLTPKSKYSQKYIKNVTLTGNHTFIDRVVTNEANGDNSIIWMTK